LARRKSNSPWGNAYKEGLPSTAVNDSIEVDEILYPSVNTGTINVATGQWEGVTLSDQNFTIDTTHLAVANGAAVLSPQAGGFDMTGYNDVIIAIKGSEAGNHAITAVMGPASDTFANLAPVNAATTLRGAGFDGRNVTVMEALVSDSVESLTADVWNIYYIGLMLQNQKNLQFKITNNTGSEEATLQFAYLRVV
jgi:hypothetical protein